MEVFSVWAMPAPGHREGFVEVMSKLREEFGGPLFEPHVTVVGAHRLPMAEAMAEACARLETACRTMKPYTCRLNQVASGTHFYQCIYVLAEPTPEVVQAHLHASRCLGKIIEDGSAYMPHLSLLYGNLSEEDKQKARAKAEGFAHLICNREFEVSSLCLYKTDTGDKSLKSWEKVAEHSLAGCKGE